MKKHSIPKLFLLGFSVTLFLFLASGLARAADPPSIVNVSTRNDLAHVYVTWSTPVQGIGSYTINDLTVTGTALSTIEPNVVIVAADVPIATTHTLTVAGEKDAGGQAQTPDPATATFGQGDFGPFCLINFDDNLLPAGTTLTKAGPGPAAYVANGVLHLTDQANDIANYWTIPIFSQNLPVFHATWKTLIAGSADGMSFNVGQNLGTGFDLAEGAPSGLSATIDTYDNGGLEVGIEVKWNGTRLAFTQVGGGGTGNAEISRGVFTDTTLDVTGTGFATFTYGPYTVSAQIPNFTGINANMYVIGGRTGGANENTWLDDICVKVPDQFSFGQAVAGNFTPSDVNVAEAFTASFSVNVTTGTPPFTYQWLKNGAEISGATSATYTTPVLTLANDGEQYTCRVRNGFSEVILGPGTIHILPDVLIMSCITHHHPNDVYVTWNKAVQGTGLYAVSSAGGAVTVTGAEVLTAQPNVVIVHTEGLAPDINYTVTVQDETDAAQNTSGQATCSFEQELAAFCNDFSGGGLPAGTFVSTFTPAAATAYVGTDGYMHLTDQNQVNATAAINFWTIPLPITETFHDFKATWRSFFRSPAGQPGADGMSFNIGEDTTPSTPFDYVDGVSPEGATVGLSVTVDNYNNGTAENGYNGFDDTGFEVRWNGKRLAYTPVDPGCQWCGAPPAINNGQWVDCSLEVTPSGLVTFKHGTFVTTAQIPNFTGIKANKYEFGARTGGAAEDAWLDDVCIQNYTLGPIGGAVSPDQVLVQKGFPTTFTAAATGSPWMTYQWLLNGSPIPGATGAKYTTPPVDFPNEGDAYSCVVNNFFSSAELPAGVVHVSQDLIMLGCSTMGDPNNIYVTWNKDVTAAGQYYIPDLPGGVGVIGVSVMPDHANIVIVQTEGIAPGGPYHLTVQDEIDVDGYTSTPNPVECTFVQQPGHYCADFNDGQIPPSTTVFHRGTGLKSVYVQDGVMHLTDNADNDSFNYWIIPLQQQNLSTLQANWRLLLGPADTFGNRADGFSLSIGTDLGTAYESSEGGANGLALNVDTYNNGNAETGIEIKWNGVRAGFTPVHSGAMHGPPELMTGQWTAASVEVTPTGFVLFKYGAFVVTAQLPNFTGIPANMYVFSGRTGGANEDCWLDDVCFNANTLGPIEVTVSGPSSVVEGRVVTLAANVSGSEPYSYQWFVDGVEVAGAINPVYALTATSALNGKPITVKVSNLLSSAESAPLAMTVLSPTYGMGGLLFEYYDTPGNGGTTVASLTSDAHFPNYPSARYYLPRFDTRAVFPDDTHEWYGGRISGWYYPPTTGDYYFWIASDDSSELYLNPNGPDPAGKIKILEEIACCHGFIRTNTSYHLVAGQPYYIEGLFKEGGGGDYMQVAATLVGDPAPINATAQSIQGANLAAVIDPQAQGSVTITAPPVGACAILQPPAPPQALLAADFNTSDGGFTLSPLTGNTPPGPWTWNQATGTWSCKGFDDCIGPLASGLVTTPIVVPNAGGVSLSFNHRYSWEGGGWDGGLVLISVNGGDPVVVPAANFTLNGYSGPILGSTILGNAFRNAWAFIETASPGYSTGAFVTSEAGLGFFNAGDIIVVGFLASWDDCTTGQDPSWEIDTVAVSFGAEVPVSASFQVAATGSAYGFTTQPAYQWQRDSGTGFADIPGANAATLIVPGLTLADTGAKFRCVATVPGASQTSAEATLTVIAGCGGMTITPAGENLDITWNSVAEDPALWGQLEGTAILGGAWVPIQASDADVALLEKGHAVMKMTTPYKFFRLKAPVQCP